MEVRFGSLAMIGECVPGHGTLSLCSLRTCWERGSSTLAGTGRSYPRARLSLSRLQIKPSFQITATGLSIPIIRAKLIRHLVSARMKDGFGGLINRVFQSSTCTIWRILRPRTPISRNTRSTTRRSGGSELSPILPAGSCAPPTRMS